MIRFITKSRELNCKNSYVVNRLSDILKYEELTINKIIKTLEDKLSGDQELFDLITNTVYPKKTKEEIIKDLKNYVEKSKMTKKEITENEKKLEGILRKIYMELLKPLENYLKQEKTMAIVLDNYRTHHGVLFKQACKYLNIDLIYLPPYSPKLNPIEQVWRTVKRELSTEFIKNKAFLFDNFERIFYENVDKKSFTEKWVDEYLLDKNNDLFISDICEIAILPA